MENFSANQAAFLLSASAKLLNRMVADLSTAELTAQPIAGANSIAWILGHLTFVDRRAIRKILGNAPELPEGYEAQFQMTGKLAEQQNTLPDVRFIIEKFNENRALFIESLTKVTPEMTREPMESKSGLFSTLGEMISFLSVHTGFHTGQVSSIRRILGKPPLF
jgi:uncharacterized damage-inducible protein DinB